MHEATAQPDGAVTDDHHGDRLLEALARLNHGTEADSAQAGDSAEFASALPPRAAGDQLVAQIRAGLLDLARPTLDRARVHEAASLRNALDGMEFVVRDDIVSGRAAGLHERLPSFVFLTLLPLLGREEALALAGQAAGLLADPA